jgi:hypothetical protein
MDAWRRRMALFPRDGLDGGNFSGFVPASLIFCDEK